jgi:FMN phosphatase YigB (HAD superfamily)/sugar phosphate isomerase/epimerase
MQTPIDAIFFDMGYTLRSTIRHTSLEKRIVGLRKIKKLLKLDISPSKLDALLTKHALEYKKWATKTLKELPEDELWTKWMLPDQPVKMVASHAIQLNTLWRSINGTPLIFPETQQVIQELFKRGYRLGLISNTTSSTETPSILKSLGLDEFMEVMVLSATFGKRKPDPTLFLHAANALLVDPSRCAYVGDQACRDVAGSRSAGFAQVILIHWPEKGHKHVRDPKLPPDQTIRNLKELLKIFPGRYPTIAPKQFPWFWKKSVDFSWDASLSTMWMMGRFAEIEGFRKSAQGLGFRRIELNHQLDLTHVEMQEFDLGEISGVHEPCPADVSMPVLKDKDWLISSLDEHNRQQGIRMVKRSIDLAHQLGAPRIILHAGQIQGTGDLEEKIRKLYQHGKQKSLEYKQLAAKARKILEKKLPLHLEAAFSSLLELVEYARPYSVQIGIENRYHYFDIPGIDEMQTLLNAAGSDQIGFVFDVGHATALDHLGYYKFEDWLERYSSRIIGVHIHDVNGIEDHLAPGLGKVDFSILAKYLPPDAFRTLEVKVNNTPEQIVTGLKLLQEKGILTQS